jgi:hypothetical protein
MKIIENAFAASVANAHGQAKIANTAGIPSERLRPGCRWLTSGNRAGPLEWRVLTFRRLPIAHFFPLRPEPVEHAW